MVRSTARADRRSCTSAGCSEAARQETRRRQPPATSPGLGHGCGLPGGWEREAARATTAGDPPARYVIHTVGPVWRGGTNGEPALLAACHSRALDVARELGARSVAFPAISCGIFG